MSNILPFILRGLCICMYACDTRKQNLCFATHEILFIFGLWFPVVLLLAQSNRISSLSTHTHTDTQSNKCSSIRDTLPSSHRPFMHCIASLAYTVSIPFVYLLIRTMITFERHSIIQSHTHTKKKQINVCCIGRRAQTHTGKQTQKHTENSILCPPAVERNNQKLFDFFTPKIPLYSK